jgi:hypothetical protein
MDKKLIAIGLSSILVIAVVYCIYQEIEDSPIAVTAAVSSAAGLFVLTGSLIPVFSKGA